MSHTPTLCRNPIACYSSSCGGPYCNDKVTSVSGKNGDNSQYNLFTGRRIFLYKSDVFLSGGAQILGDMRHINHTPVTPHLFASDENTAVTSRGPHAGHRTRFYVSQRPVPWAACLYCDMAPDSHIWLVSWLIYSCCSHLEHRASVKRFVSLQFLNLRH
jgi:hypothetical protein